MVVSFHAGQKVASGGFPLYRALAWYLCLELRTVKELMEGSASGRLPSVATLDETSKKASKAKAKGMQQTGLGL